MIEYAKKILPEVCNWKELFRKELIKCVEWAGPDNSDEIYNWCCSHYAGKHSDVIEEVFPGKIKKSSSFNRFNEIPTTMATSVSENSNKQTRIKKDKILVQK